MGYFVKYGKQRIKDNKNLLAIFLGGTGSGKTYASLKYAELLDKHFTVDRVVFTTEEFMKLLNSNLKSGSVIVYDEIGVGHAARQWHSMANQMFNYILQTFRHKNIIVLFSTPDLSFLDKTARKLIHITFGTLSIDKKKKLCTCKPLLTENNPTYDKIYRKYPVILKDYKQVTIKRVKFGLPSKTLLEAYEAKKDAYTKELNTGIMNQLAVNKVKAKGREVFNPEDYVEKAKALDKTTIAYIRVRLGLSDSKARMVKALL